MQLNNAFIEESLDKLLRHDELLLASNEFFFLAENGRFLKLLWKDVKSIKADRCYIIIKTDSGQHMVYSSMIKIERILPPGLFCRIHRSWIIPFSRITEVKRQWIVAGDETFRLSKAYRRHLLKTLYPFVLNRQSIT